MIGYWESMVSAFLKRVMTCDDLFRLFVVGHPDSSWAHRSKRKLDLSGPAWQQP